MRRLQYTALFVSLAATLGCSSSNKVKYKNSALGNMHPAPVTMSPPDEGNGESTLDPTYVRTKADYHFARGEAFSLDGDNEKAIEEFKLTLVYDAKAPRVFLRLGTEYLRMGAINEAVEQAEAGLKIDPDHSDLRVFLGGLYTTLKMYPQAREQYNELLRIKPKDAEAYIYLGAVEAEDENFKEAINYFRKAAQTKGFKKSHIAYYYMAKTYVAMGKSQYKQAVKSLNKALSAKPSFEEAALSLSDIYFAQERPNKAIKLLESFQAYHGPRKNVAYQLSQTYLEREDFAKAYKHLKELESFEPSNLNVKVKLALILIEQKQFYEAIDKLEEITQLAPSSDKIRYYLAAVYEEVKNVKLAVYNYRNIASSSSYYPDAVVRAANLMRQNGNINGASNVLRQALKADVATPSIYAYYATILDDLKQYKQGVQVLEAGIKKYPTNTQLHFYLGSMYERTGRVEETIKQMRKVLKHDSNHVQALNFLAYTFAEQSVRLDEAESLALKAVDLNPKDPFVMDTVGWVYFKRGKVEEAIRYLEAAYQTRPSESIIAEHLGDAYYVYELRDKAKEMYLRAVALETDPKKADKIRAKIITIDKVQEDDLRAPAGISDNK